LGDGPEGGGMKHVSAALAAIVHADLPLGVFLRQPQRVRITLEIEVPLLTTAEHLREFIERKFYDGRPVSVSNPLAHDELTPVDETLRWDRL
jgi:hypothetical protein